jgi:hypothetical protein
MYFVIFSFDDIRNINTNEDIKNEHWNNLVIRLCIITNDETQNNT